MCDICCILFYLAREICCILFYLAREIKNMCMRKKKFIFIYLFIGTRIGNKKY